MCETVDFYREYEKKYSCEFSNTLRAHRSQLFQFITNFTIAHARLKFDRNFCSQNEIKFKNISFRSILEKFVTIKKNKFSDVTELKNEISFFNLSKSTLIFLPLKWESFFAKNKIESDNAKNCESDSSKNEEDNTENFQVKINFIKITQLFDKNDANSKKNKIPNLKSQSGFCYQRPVKFKTIRFDKTMSRIFRLLPLNLGGRGYRFNMTLESRISRFKLIK